MYKFINDKYKKARGGTSRILDVCCDDCEAHVSYYQKDGPGILKRMYVDRFIDYRPNGNELICKKCNKVLGVLIVYKKESRPAYRLFVSAVTKKMVSAKDI